jgi:hypothetical protein
VTGRLRALFTLPVLGAALALGACAEKPQTMDMAARKADTAPWAVSNAATPAFIAPGWKLGDKTAWDEQMVKRNQAQNDYVR